MTAKKSSSNCKSELLRHKNILLCPWNALAMLLFYKWHICCEPVPDFSNPGWAMQPLFHTKPALEDPCLEQFCGSAYTEFIDAANTGTQQHKYMTESAYAVVSEGLSSSKLLRNTIYSAQNMHVTRRYLQNGLCADVQLANAGFFTKDRQQPYNVPRKLFNVSLALEESIFPFADELPSFESMDSNKAGYDVRDTTVRFCNLLKALRMVLLQDMAILFDIPFYRRMLQKSAIFSSSILQSLDFISCTDYIRDLSWSSDFLPLVECQPYDARLSRVVPSAVIELAASENRAKATQPLEESVPQGVAVDDSTSISMNGFIPEADSSKPPTASEGPAEATKPLEDGTTQDMLNGDLPDGKSVTETSSTPQTDQSCADSALGLADGKTTVNNQVDEGACDTDNGLIVLPKGAEEGVPSQEPPEAAITFEDPAPVAGPPAVKFIPIQPRPPALGPSSAKSDLQKRNLDSSEPAHPESSQPAPKRLCVKGTPVSNQAPAIQKSELIFVDLTIDGDENIDMDSASAINIDSGVGSRNSSSKNQPLAQANRVTEPANPVPANAKPTVPASDGDQESATSPTTAGYSPIAEAHARNEYKMDSEILPAANSNFNSQADKWYRKPHEAKEDSSNLSTDSDQTLAVVDSGCEQHNGAENQQKLPDLTKLYKKAALADKLLAAMRNLQSDVSSISGNNQAMLRKISRIIARQKHPESPARRRHTQGPADAPQASNPKLLYSLDKLQIVTRRTNDHISKLASAISQTVEEADGAMSEI
ncbi:hypothetical protein LPJ55_002337 [Coemansia sp. RSA 990]|nr:hypothetical protein LPJ68_002238 [Coemansia sp. RSA 1086]KAJ1750319.1 hypothetical protein LPJ79_003018 [Coemansia sp. RSA 1821]KAJ1873386.1 hypothetical protein LPJ55_002337 [Coemansia sp. RSA 990]KAJ2671331.1 hypothetical protein IWW42_003454 [Coemansia sp. RSA 1085]